MKDRIKERIFLVGCPRSGTTLLQSLLAANSKVLSFPETHFFGHLFYSRKLLSILGIANWRARLRWIQFLKEIGHQEMQSKLPKYAVFVRQFSKAYIDVLDTLTLNQGKEIWVEKTPGNLHYIEKIEKLVTSAKFVHIIRNGTDVVASLYEVTNEYPEVWGENGWSVEQCISRWIQDIQLSLSYSSKENHTLVSYEKLVAEPRPVLMSLCKSINISFEEQMISNYSQVSKQVILENEPWKAFTGQPIKARHNIKFQTLFDKDQRQYILDRLSDYTSLDMAVENKNFCNTSN